jgi:ABC-type multidrug transport system fused ATPase/permease subunit
MAEGEVVESGTHDDLVRRGAQYANLVAAQLAITGPDLGLRGAI